MGPEGIQFLAITHPHYVEKMNGEDIPNIDLPDYAVSPSGSGNFYGAPYLCFNRGTGRLYLSDRLVDDRSPKSGCATLR